MAKKRGPKPKPDPAEQIGNEWIHQIKGSEFSKRKVGKCQGDQCGVSAKLGKKGLCWECEIIEAKRNQKIVAELLDAKQ